jgi:hypothetical protein
MITPTEFSRLCPQCNNLVYHRNLYGLTRAIKRKGMCYSCASHNKSKAKATIQTVLESIYRKTMKDCLRPCSKKIFTISKEEYFSLLFMRCFYCNTPPIKHYDSDTHKLCLVNGVDRFHNELGYISGNCVPCCTACNFLKSNMGPEIFLALVARIHNFSLEKRRLEVFGPQELHILKNYKPDNEPESELLVIARELDIMLL